METIKKKTLFFSWCIALAFFLACSGDNGGGSDTKQLTIEGTAATGAPIVGTVSVKGADGRLQSSAIRADGSYSVNVSSLEAPFIIYVEGHAHGRRVRLYSTVFSPGIVNVTPASNAVVAVALGADPLTSYPPEEFLDGSHQLAAPGEEDVEWAKTAIAGLIGGLFEALDIDAAFDIMTGEFAADGTGFDALLDSVSIEVEGDSLVLSDSVESTRYFEAPVDDIENPTTEDLDGLALAVENNLTLKDELIALMEQWIAALGSANEASARAALDTVYSESFLEDGRIKDDMIDNQIDENWQAFSTGEATAEISRLTPIPPREPFSYPAGTSEYMGSTYTIEGADLYLYPTGEDIMIAEVTFDLVFSGSGIRETGTEAWYFINESGSWKILGNQSPLDLYLEARNERIIDEYWGDIFDGGFDSMPRDETSYALNEKEISAVIIIGDGITAQYATDGRKGLFFIRDTSNEFNLINTDNTGSPYGQNHYFESDGLDIAEIQDLRYSVIGLSFDPVTNTFTPVCAWEERLDRPPLSPDSGTLTREMFADIISPSSYTLSFSGLPWSMTVSWTIPEGSTNAGGYLSYGGYFLDIDGVTKIYEEVTIEEGPTTDSSYTYTLTESDTSITVMEWVNVNVGVDDALGNDFITRKHLH